MEESNEKPKEEAKPKNFIEEAREERQRLDKVLNDLKAENSRLESLKAEAILSGRTDAGKPADKPKEESPKDYAKRVLSGKL